MQNNGQPDKSYSTEIAGLSAFAIGLHFLAHSNWPLFIAIALGGFPLVLDLSRKMAKREFGADLLAGISIVTSVLLAQYLVAVIVILMLSGGTALEGHAKRRASSVLRALAQRSPRVAHRRSGCHVADVSLADVVPGEELVVFPHEACPVDGAVIDGQGFMDESYLTGEPFQISKAPGASVLSGAINGDTPLTIRATRAASDSRFAQIMRVMEEAQQNRPRMRRIADALGAWYTPFALAIATAAWLGARDPSRFLAVLVIATPCPLLIAIPVAVIGGISLAAKRGIIIRNPAALEQVSACRTLIFDKTGTLTYGRPSLVEIVVTHDPAVSFTPADILRMTASLEVYSKHPLASAILAAAKEKAVGLEVVDHLSERPGAGLEGTIAGHHIELAGRSRLSGKETDVPPPVHGLECVVLVDGRYAALLRFCDAPREDSKTFVQHLPRRHGFDRIMLLSGDRESEVQYLAHELRINEAYFGKTPEEKVAIVRAEVKRAKTLYAGDGINDAPALQAASIGIAFGQQSDITSEAADAVILTPTLRKVDELLHIGDRMRRIALQSAMGGMAASLLGMLAASLGLLPPLEGAIAQELIDLVAVLNALRVALPVRQLSDF